MKTIKTIDAVVVYELLNASMLGKMESKDKFNVIKTIKVLKEVAEKYKTFREDSEAKLRSDKHGEMVAKAQKWQMISNEDKKAVNDYFFKLNNDVDKCTEEERNKIHELDIRTITEAAFGALMDANESWTAEQIMRLEELLVA